MEELGPGVTGFAAGDVVASTSVLGSYAEYALVPAAQLVKTPVGHNAPAGCRRHVAGNDGALSLLLHPPAQGRGNRAGACRRGRRGLAPYADGVRIGARVITTVSTPKRELSREAGASEVINYAEQDFEGGEASHQRQRRRRGLRFCGQDHL